MAIAKFTGGPPGPKGDTGPTADRDINSMIMLSWIAQPIAKGLDLYTNNFSTNKGVDSSSTAIYNSAGFYEPPQARDDYLFNYDFDSTDKVVRVDNKGSIAWWYQDNGDYGHFEGVTLTVTSGGVAVDKGGGKVGLPCVGQSLATGNSIEVRGTTYYNGTNTVDATSSADEVVITSAYNAETFGNTATIHQRIGVGAGLDNTVVQPSMSVEFYDGNPLSILVASGSVYQSARLASAKPSARVSGIYEVSCNGTSVYPSYAYSTAASGWRQVFNEVPNTRGWTSMVYDPVSKDLWAFGGYKNDTAARTNEMWRYSTASGQWFYVITNAPPAAREGHTMVYDPVNAQFLLFGGYTGSAYLQDLYKFNPLNSQWTSLSPTGGPPGLRNAHAAGYSSVSGTMLIYGGYNGSARLNDVWEYNIGTNVWKQIVPTLNGMTGRSDTQYCYQTVSGALVIHGGWIAAETGETWKFDYYKNEFRKLTSSPYTARAGAAFYDETSDKMYHIGGYYNNLMNTQVPVIYSYDFKSAWGQVIPNPNNGPTLMYYFAYAYDTDKREFYTYAGHNSANYHATTALWKYNVPANTWDTIHPQALARLGGAYATKTNKFYIGFGTPLIASSYYGGQELWEYDCSNGVWTRISNYYLVNNRDGGVMYLPIAYSPNLHCLFAFGGQTTLGASANLNILRMFDLNASYTANNHNWQTLYPSGQWPTAKAEQLQAYDTDNDVLYLLGGSGSNAEFWKYDAVTNSFVRLQIPGLALTVRWATSMVYDNINKCLWAWCGYTGTAYVNELWRFDIATQLWTQIAYGGAVPPIRGNTCVVFDEVTQSLYLFSGTANGTAPITPVDFFKYDVRTNTVYKITDTWSPNARFNYAAGFNSRTGEMYVYGGVTSALKSTTDCIAYKVWDRTTTSGVVATMTSGTGFPAACNSIGHIVVDDSLVGSSDIYHALSFDSTSSFKMLSVGPEIALNDRSSVVDKGSGLVGFPCNSHPFSPGDFLRAYNTDHYNTNYSVDPATSTNEIVVSGTYIAETFTSSAKVRKVIGWKSIVQQSGGSWQYLTDASVWQNASSNDVKAALQQAFTVSGNRMNGAALESIYPAEYTMASGYTSGDSLDFGVGFYSPSSPLPELSRYEVIYSAGSNNLTLFTEAWSASQNDPTATKCLIKTTYTGSITLDMDLTVWVSIDGGVNYEQISGLSLLRSDGNEHYIAGSKINITPRGSNQVKLKITTHNSKEIRINSVGMAVGY
jgi:hypothetical protein